MPRRLPEPLDYRCGWPNRLPPARAGDLAFIRFCTPKLSERRSADHETLTGRARFHLRNAQWLIGRPRRQRRGSTGGSWAGTSGAGIGTTTMTG